MKCLLYLILCDSLPGLGTVPESGAKLLDVAGIILCQGEDLVIRGCTDFASTCSKTTFQELSEMLPVEGRHLEDTDGFEKRTPWVSK
jgi:hypothetical protein